MKKIEVCFTPDLLHLHDLTEFNVVIVDILRATSSMTTAFAHGVKSIIPVAKVEECMALKLMGCVAAAERGGKMVEGFDLGNSPFDYMDKNLKDKTIAMTTTNGTLAISKSKEAKEVIIGSFLNISAVINHLQESNENTLVVCAGWKGQPNMEDTIFAGAIIESLKKEFTVSQDSALLSNAMYNIGKRNIYSFISNSSHFKRLQGFGLDKDIEYCLTNDMYNVLPILNGDEIEVVPEKYGRSAAGI